MYDSSKLRTKQSQNSPVLQ